MWRWGVLAWLCAGALGAGILATVGARRNASFKKIWFLVAFAIGPVFLFFVLPAWIDQWRKRGPE